MYMVTWNFKNDFTTKLNGGGFKVLYDKKFDLTWLKNKSK